MNVRSCSPEDIAVKSFFLGPQSENGHWFHKQLSALVNRYLTWRKKQFPKDGRAISRRDQAEVLFKKSQSELHLQLHKLFTRLERETPKFTPRYVSHMVSEISIPAMLGHILMVLHNPNNASREAAYVGLEIEKEAIGKLLKMIGIPKQRGTGHFTSGGSVANIEGLWRARFRLDHFLSLGLLLRAQKKLEEDAFFLASMGWKRFNRLLAEHRVNEDDMRPFSAVASSPWKVSQKFKEVFGTDYRGPVILAPNNVHYSWPKAVSLLGMGEEALWGVALDGEGRLDCDDLRHKIKLAKEQDRPVLAVVSVAGTTELGEVDPVDRVQDVLDDLRSTGVDLWHHVDAAYGGFYCSLLRSKKTKSLRLDSRVNRALESIHRATSITIDPHKLGYLPYSCGAILVSDQENDRVTSFSASYITRKDPKSEFWTSTLEGSRSGAGPAALYLSANTLGLNASGLGRVLSQGIESREKLSKALLKGVPNLYVIEPADTNILCFNIAKKDEKLSLTNLRNENLYQKICRGKSFAVSRTRLKMRDYGKLIQSHLSKWNGQIDDKSLVLIRLVLMNPFIISKEMDTNFISELTAYFDHHAKTLE